MTTPLPIENLIEFDDKKGNSFWLIDFYEEDKSLYVYRPLPRSFDTSISLERGDIYVTDVSEEVLKKIKVWDLLSKGLQLQVQQSETIEKNGKHEKMAHARGKRKKKYPGVPREIACRKCNNPQPIQPSLLLQRAEKAGIEFEEWITRFECQVCKPTKGRKANPKYAGLPKKMTCACGFQTASNFVILDATAESKKTTIKELIESYVCRACKKEKKE